MARIGATAMVKAVWIVGAMIWVPILALFIYAAAVGPIAPSYYSYHVDER